MKASVVIDLGFGDSGKGVTVDSLAKDKIEDNLVVRFSGGHQVGHTVSVDGFQHTFSNFGAGTLRGVPTFYSAHTTVFPPALAIEYEKVKFSSPSLYFDPLVMVTTPYDIAFNRAREITLKHGSCGVGFGATIERNQNGLTLFINDLKNAWVFSEKLKSIHAYYVNKAKNEGFELAFINEIENICVDQFIEICCDIRDLYEIIQFKDIARKYSHLIFEGSQGIMLDQLHGIFPHVTRSYTTSKNAFELLRKLDVPCDVDVYYVTRCYQTRHGNGPMSNNRGLDLCNSDSESNKANKYQGDFRIAEIDTELVNYALSTDEIYHIDLTKDPDRDKTIRKKLVVTCLDQRPDFDLKSFVSGLDCDFKEIHGSFSPDSEAFRMMAV